MILAIGTELSTGQVINSNAAWIAQQLTDAGAGDLLHWTMPDEKALMRDALDAAAARSDLLILTGGLGPTADDFTREVVAEWMGAQLEFHQPSWERIEARAQAYGFKLVEAQKQQCWFPVGAEIFPNPVGTADAFACRRGQTQLVVLPGPPFEIRNLWQSAVGAFLQPVMPERPPLRLYRWQCLGIPEGSLGEIVEAAVAGEPGLITGYRAHAPYIEVKLWVPESHDAAPVLERLEAAIGEWIVLRDDADAAGDLLSALAGKAVTLHDAATGGLLAARLQQALGQVTDRPMLSLQTRWHGLAESPDPQDAMTWLAESTASPETLLLAIGGPVGKQWSLGLRRNGSLRFECFDLPFAMTAATAQAAGERSLRYICEMAMMTAAKWLQELPPTITTPESENHD